MSDPSTFSHGLRAIDCMINPRWRGDLTPKGHFKYRDAASKGFQHPAQYMFKDQPEIMGEGQTPESVVETMDRFGIERAVLTVSVVGDAGSSAHTKGMLECLERYPDRFFAKLNIDPNEGMTAMRQIDAYLGGKYPGIKGIWMGGYEVLKPYNDKIYYPIYTKAIEYDVPVTVSVGIPGPRVPGECQNPIYLDEVAYFYPDLKIVMAHGGEPWEALCVKLLLKWPNMYYQTSAFLPKYYPEAIIKFANTRGADKIMYAGYWPAVAYERLQGDMADVPFRDNVWPKFLRENAIRLFKLGEA